MKINFVKKTEHPILFSEIGVGACFVLDSERRYRQDIQKVNVYMKIQKCIPVDMDDSYDSNETINTVNLSDGTALFIEDDDEIILIPATLNAEAL